MVAASDADVTVKQVLRYFLRHPNAADDLEALARWRLAEEAIRTSVDETQRAVSWLVKHEFLCPIRTPGSTTLFSLNPGKIAEAAALTARTATAPTPDRR